MYTTTRATNVIYFCYYRNFRWHGNQLRFPVFSCRLAVANAGRRHRRYDPSSQSEGTPSFPRPQRNPRLCRYDITRGRYSFILRTYVDMNMDFTRTHGHVIHDVLGTSGVSFFRVRPLALRPPLPCTWICRGVVREHARELLVTACAIVRSFVVPPLVP